MALAGIYFPGRNARGKAHESLFWPKGGGGSHGDSVSLFAIAGAVRLRPPCGALGFLVCPVVVKAPISAARPMSRRPVMRADPPPEDLATGSVGDRGEVDHDRSFFRIVFWLPFGVHASLTGASLALSYYSR